jgi:antitoxin component YwqK of YwqJK toxin-antitoxin module
MTLDFPYFCEMAKRAFITFLTGLFFSSVWFSCTPLKMISESWSPQASFPISRLDDTSAFIKVLNYDTVSFYDSPYQTYMLNNSDKPDGRFIVYDESNTIRRILHYKNHKREGKDTWFYADGNNMQEKIFVHDRYTSYKLYFLSPHVIDTELSDTLGYKKSWNTSGQLIYEKNYQTGSFKEWYSNGKLKLTGMECPGECYAFKGPWSYYSTEGKLDEIIFYGFTQDQDSWDSIYHYKGNNIQYVERK